MIRNFAAVFLLVLFAERSCAQESINVPAPTQPATGVIGYRQQFTWTEFGSSSFCDRTFDIWESKTLLTYGLNGNTALELQIPFAQLDPCDSMDDDLNAGMIRIGVKRRVWQSDSGATDTARVSLLAGLIFPGGAAEMTGVGVRPQIGAVGMMVHGRHGFTAAGRYTFSFAGPEDHYLPGSGNASLLELDGAYLYRIFPAEYSEEHPDAWYLVAEITHYYETNGDRELLVTPGLLFEGTVFAAEIGIQLPVAQHLNHRPERNFTLVTGLRFLF